MKADEEFQNLHKNHRNRMRERFLEHPESLSKHEIVELLLFYSIPQKNTNPLAHSLIDKYGTLKNLFAADKEDLMTVPGVGEKTASFIKLLGKLFGYVAEEEADKVTFYSLDSVRPYLLRVLGRQTGECFCAFYLNDANKIMKREFCTQNDSGKVEIDLPALHKTCILVKPQKVVIAHNHPSGYLEPSLQDDRMTDKIAQFLKIIGVKFYDHLIVGPNDVYSYQSDGRFEALSIERV